MLNAPLFAESMGELPTLYGTEHILEWSLFGLLRLAFFLFSLVIAMNVKFRLLGCYLHFSNNPWSSLFSGMRARD